MVSVGAVLSSLSVDCLFSRHYNTLLVLLYEYM